MQFDIIGGITEPTDECKYCHDRIYGSFPAGWYRGEDDKVVCSKKKCQEKDKCNT